MPMSKSRRWLAPLSAVLAFASSEPAGAFASSHRAEPCEQGRALKNAYLRCERQAQDEALPRSGIAECSEIYETLKQAVFGGSYAALRAWYDQSEGLGGKVSTGADIAVSQTPEDCAAVR